MAELTKKEQIYNEVEKDKKTVLGSSLFFAAANPLLQKINRGLAFTSVQIAKLETSIVSLNVPEAPQPVIEPVAVQEEKESISATRSRSGVGTASGLAALGFIVPLLLNKEAREYLSSFLAGLIGIDKLELISNAIKAVTVVLTGVFAYKVFKQVADAFESLKRLWNLISELFSLTSDNADAVDEKDKDLKQKRDKLKKNQQKRKKSRKKAKNAEMVRRKANRAKRIKKLKNIRTAKNSISAIKKALLIGGPIGIAAGVVGGIAIGSIIDLIAGPNEDVEVEEDKADVEPEEAPELATEENDDDFVVEDEPEETPVLEPEVKEVPIDASTVGKVIADNAIQELSAGFFDLEGAKKAFGWAKSKLFGGGKEGTQPVQKASPASNIPKPVESLPRSKPESKPVVSEPTASTPVSSAPVKDLQPVVATTTPTAGERIINESSAVSAVKKDQQTSNIMVNNVDNSTIVVMKEEVTRTSEPLTFAPLYA